MDSFKNTKILKYPLPQINIKYPVSTNQLSPDIIINTFLKFGWIQLRRFKKMNNRLEKTLKDELTDKFYVSKVLMLISAMFTANPLKVF